MSNRQQQEAKYHKSAEAAYRETLARSGGNPAAAAMLTAGFNDGFTSGFAAGMEVARLAVIGGMETLVSGMQEPVSIKTARESAEVFLAALRGEQP